MKKADLPASRSRGGTSKKLPPAGPPEALTDFMLKDWAAPSGAPIQPLPHAAAFAARRRALSRRFPGEAIVVPTGHEKVRANDTNYPFRPGSDFYYLTGNLEPDCVLVMVPKPRGGHRDILFVEPNPGRSDPTFFTDRVKGELWVGPRLGVEQSRARFGVHECRGLPVLPETLASIAGKHRLLRDMSASVDRALHQSLHPKAQRRADRELASFLSEMRLIKEPLEIGELQRAVRSTRRAFDDVILRLRTAKSEREVEGVFNLRARVEGNDVGYGTIAASGQHACVLHWTRNDGRLSKKDLLLLDAGVEQTSLYTADVTRTLPISGRFSKAQREVYELVLRAQKAALAAVRPGNDFMDPNRAAMEILAHGLEAMGILPDAEHALRDDQQLYKRYTLHNVSHMLGIDVHDCAQARQETYRYGKLRPGMVLTVEPGLYFQIDDQTVPKRYRGIGVRIEDDVLVTPRGMKNLTAGFPTEAADVEAWMAKIWKKAATKKTG